MDERSTAKAWLRRLRGGPADTAIRPTRGGANSRAEVNVTTPNHPGSRFLTLSDVAEILNISASQARALVLRQDLRGIKLGGRGVWRVERSALESYIDRLYQETEQFLSEHPLDDDVPVDEAAHDDATHDGGPSH